MAGACPNRPVSDKKSKFRIVPPKRSEMRQIGRNGQLTLVTEIRMYRISGIDESKEWFAFRVRPQHEKQVSLSLREKGFNEFLPLLKSKRQWADRTKVVETPLFPGYIFCSTTRAATVPVLMTSGVMYVARAGNAPPPADRVEIEALQIAPYVSEVDERRTA